MGAAGPPPPVDLIAHRGFADDAAENTLPALRDAARSADAVEFDVRRCGSGHLVVCHDETVDRVTDSAGPLRTFTATELGAMDVLNSGTGIPTLESVLDALPATTVHVELKERGLAADAVRRFEGYDGEVVVSAFDPDVLATVSELTDIPLAYLGRDPDIRAAAELGCAYVHPERTAVDTSFVERAHGAGLGVNVWTVKSRAEAERLRAAGADGLIADSAGVM